MNRPLEIHEMARQSGFSEATLRYYEKLGLLGPVGRDPRTGHRRYDAETADRVDALACLRSAGVSVEGMREYVALLARGAEAAGKLRELFDGQAQRLAAEIDRLRVRQEYLQLKAELWEARLRGDHQAEAETVGRVEQILKSF